MFFFMTVGPLINRTEIVELMTIVKKNNSSAREVLKISLRNDKIRLKNIQTENTELKKVHYQSQLLAIMMA